MSSDRLDDFLEATFALRAAELVCAKLLVEFDRERSSDGGTRRSWQDFLCSDIGEFGERSGISADCTRRLLAAGLALKVEPAFEAHVRSGEITVANAAVAGELSSRPDLRREGEDVLRLAATHTTKQLRKIVQRRKEEARVGPEPVVSVTVHVRESARCEFKRAQEIASGKASRKLSEGETFEVVVDHYLDTFDVDRVKPGKRRTPDTAMVDGRYVPMDIRRALLERQGRKCAIPFCDNSIFLDKAHIVPHAAGGSREIDNLVLLCSRHHFEFDIGAIQFAGTAAAPVFLDMYGRDLAKRFAPGFYMGYSIPKADAPQVGPREALPPQTVDRSDAQSGDPAGPSPPAPDTS